MPDDKEFDEQSPFPSPTPSGDPEDAEYRRAGLIPYAPFPDSDCRVWTRPDHDHERTFMFRAPDGDGDLWWYFSRFHNELSARNILGPPPNDIAGLKDEILRKLGDYFRACSQHPNVGVDGQATHLGRPRQEAVTAGIRRRKLGVAGMRNFVDLMAIYNSRFPSMTRDEQVDEWDRFSAAMRRRTALEASRSARPIVKRKGTKRRPKRRES